MPSLREVLSGFEAIDDSIQAFLLEALPDMLDDERLEMLESFEIEGEAAAAVLATLGDAVVEDTPVDTGSATTALLDAPITLGAPKEPTTAVPPAAAEDIPVTEPTPYDAAAGSNLVKQTEQSKSKVYATVRNTSGRSNTEPNPEGRPNMPSKRKVRNKKEQKGVSRDQLAIDAFRKVLGDALPEASVDALAGCFYEEAMESASSWGQDEERWSEALREGIEGSIDDVDEAAGTLLCILQFSGFTAMFERKPEELIAVAEAGDRCLGLLAEDGEWHQAVVEEVLTANEVIVRFEEFGGTTRTLPRLEVCLHSELAQKEDTEGQCAICSRKMPLTRHHLYPRSTHEHCTKRLAKTKEELESDTYICRQCHTAVHRFRDHMELATNWYTLELIMSAPEMQRWAKYANRLPATTTHKESVYRR
jgi:hypothetical protein